MAMLAARTLASDAGVKVTPIEKVLTMLTELQEKVVREGREEAKTYDKFACFCKDTAEEKTWDIEDNQALVDDLVSKIDKLTANRVALDEKLETLNREIGEVTERMDAASKENAKHVKVYL